MTLLTELLRRRFSALWLPDYRQPSPVRGGIFVERAIKRPFKLRQERHIIFRARRIRQALDKIPIASTKCEIQASFRFSSSICGWRGICCAKKHCVVRALPVVCGQLITIL
jgi:hypothetical protein